MEDELRASLGASYVSKVRKRDLNAVQPRKEEERLRFLALLRSEEARILLELGVGPGKDGEFFHDSGLEVVCADLSPEMVALCARKGLAARVIELSNLDLPLGTFDAVYELNCLLHVPDRELPAALRRIRGVLKPGGHFYLGVYGGTEHESVWSGDPYAPKRYFFLRTDERLREIVASSFEVHSFRRIALDERPAGLHLQSVILRKQR